MPLLPLLLFLTFPLQSPGQEVKDEVIPVHETLPEDLNDTPEAILSLRKVPEGRPLDVKGQEYWCYTMPERDELEYIHVDYRDLWFYSIYLTENQARLNNDITFLEGQLLSWQTKAENQKKRNDFLMKLWDTEHKLRLKIENKSNNWQAVAWTIVVVESIIFASLSAYAIANTHQ
jgi:hypothetical protein